MRYSPHEDMFDERVIALSFPINLENLMEKDAHNFSTINREESRLIKDEPRTLRICHQRYNRLYPLFKSNRLLPTISGKYEKITRCKIDTIVFYFLTCGVSS